jgi:hypothetical protein
MWESWRTYLSFALVGAIFVVCQAVSGGLGGREGDPGDRGMRDGRSDAAGRISLAGDGLLMVPAPQAPATVDRR